MGVWHLEPGGDKKGSARTLQVTPGGTRSPLPPPQFQFSLGTGNSGGGVVPGDALAQVAEGKHPMVLGSPRDPPPCEVQGSPWSWGMGSGHPLLEMGGVGTGGTPKIPKP